MTSSQMQANEPCYLINVGEIAVYRIALQIELCIQKEESNVSFMIVGASSARSRSVAIFEMNGSKLSMLVLS